MIEPDVFEADREWDMPLTEGEWGQDEQDDEEDSAPPARPPKRKS